MIEDPSATPKSVEFRVDAEAGSGGEGGGVVGLGDAMEISNGFDGRVGDNDAGDNEPSEESGGFEIAIPRTGANSIDDADGSDRMGTDEVSPVTTAFESRIKPLPLSGGFEGTGSRFEVGSKDGETGAGEDAGAGAVDDEAPITRFPIKYPAAATPNPARGKM
jgi:hypothetical protein